MDQNAAGHRNNIRLLYLGKDTVTMTKRKPNVGTVRNVLNNVNMMNHWNPERGGRR